MHDDEPNQHSDSFKPSGFVSASLKNGTYADMYNESILHTLTMDWRLSTKKFRRANGQNCAAIRRGGRA
jgi:hypothetical protein